MNYGKISILLIVVICVAGVGGYTTFGVIGETTKLNPIGDKDSESDLSVYNNNNINSNTDLINQTLNGVVTIYSQSNNEELESQGSGFLYKDSYIMTNEHVIKNSNNYYIRYKNGDWSEANLVGSDIHTDIAILEYDEKPSYADSLPVQINIPKTGQRVISLGAPSGLDNTVTSGIISGTERSVKIGTEFAIPDTIQTDTALNPGNSGGPLVSTSNGAVVGVNRATDGENIGYAVSSRIANSIGTSIIDKGYYRHSYIGIRTIQLSPVVEEYDNVGVNKGLVVKETIRGSPAEGKFNTGGNTTEPDVIVGIEDEKVTTNEDIASYLMRKTEPGQKVEFKVYRNETYANVTMKLGSRQEYTG